MNIDPKVNEAIETLNMKDGPTRRRLLSGAGLVSVSAAAAGLLAACTLERASSAAKSAAGNFPNTPKWKFVFVCHVTTNPFFTPTQYGAGTPATLLGCSLPSGRGSKNSIVAEMVNATQHRDQRQGGRDRRAPWSTSRVHHPGEERDERRHPGRLATTPTAARDDPVGTNRLAYIGQGLYDSGYALGQRSTRRCPTPGTWSAFIATPGQLNIQPRIDGATAAFKALRQGASNFTAVGDRRRRDQGPVHHRRVRPGAPDLAGMLAVDAGSTQTVGADGGQVRAAHKVKVAGRLRPDPETLARSRAATSTTPSTSSRTCRASCRSLYALPVQPVRRPDHPAADQHRPAVRHQGHVDPYQRPRAGIEGSTTAQKLHPARIRRDRTRLTSASSGPAERLVRAATGRLGRKRPARPPQ